MSTNLVCKMRIKRIISMEKFKKKLFYDIFITSKMHAKHSVNLDNKIFLVFMKMTQMTSLFNQNEIFFVFFEFVNLLHGRCICMSLSRMYIEYYQFIIMFYGCHRRWCNKVMILNELLFFLKKFFTDFLVIFLK